MYRGFTHSFMKVTLSPSFGPFFERNHSFGVKMVSQNVPKTFKSCPYAWYPARAKEIYIPGKRSYIPGPICKLFHFALSLLNWEIAITSERVAPLTWFFGSMPKIIIYDHLILLKKMISTNRFCVATPLSWALHCVTVSLIDAANKILNAIWRPWRTP